MQKKMVIPFDFSERKTVQIVQALSIMAGAPLYCTKDGRTINMNSILGVLSINIKQGDTVIFSSEDPNKVKCIEDILFFNYLD